MTARISSLPLPRPTAGRDVVIVTGVALAATLAGYQLAQGSRISAIALCLLPLVAILLARPTVPLVLLGASLPFLHSFTLAATSQPSATCCSSS